MRRGVREMRCFLKRWPNPTPLNRHLLVKSLIFPNDISRWDLMSVATIEGNKTRRLETFIDGCRERAADGTSVRCRVAQVAPPTTLRRGTCRSPAGCGPGAVQVTE